MLNSIFTTTSSGTSVTLPTFILAMATAMLLGLVTALVYLKLITHVCHHRSFHLRWFIAGRNRGHYHVSG